MSKQTGKPIAEKPYSVDLGEVLSKTEGFELTKPSVDIMRDDNGSINMKKFWSAIDDYLSMTQPEFLSLEGLCFVIGITISELNKILDMEVDAVNGSELYVKGARWRSREVEKAVMILRARQLAHAKVNKSNMLLSAFKAEHGDAVLSETKKKAKEARRENNVPSSKYLEI